LTVYDESIAVLRRSLHAAKLDHSDKRHGLSRLDAFVRSIEHGRTPEADVAAAIARERAMSPSLGGRTVFDDARRRRDGTGKRGQLALFPK
jgi:hypothetical protein